MFKNIRNKKAAMLAAKEFRWKDVIKLKRRFEHVWIVGKADFEPTYKAGIAFKAYSVPMLRWEKNLGVTFCPVFKFEIKNI
jgi:hypothetical protein